MPSPRGALQSPGLVGGGRPVVGEDDEEEAETKKMLERNHPKGADAKAAAEYRLAQAPQRVGHTTGGSAEARQAVVNFLGGLR